MLDRKILWLLLLVFVHISTYGQDITRNNQRNLEIKGLVAEKESRKPIANVDVSILGGRFTRTDIDGRFVIRAKVGDELMVDHPSFQTVYYTIKNDDDIRVYVEENPLDEEVASELEESEMKMEFKSRSKKLASPDLHKIYNDSAEFYKKNDIAKSVLFVEKALASLGKRKSDAKQAESFAVLGDIYFYWKQYDLAVSNYRTSLTADQAPEIKLKLAQSLLLTGDVQESMDYFKQLLDEETSNYQKILAHEGLGDANSKLGRFKEAESDYKEALKIAKANLVTPKVTDLNSKLAELFAQKGELDQAEGFFKNSLNLASEENVKRSAKQKEIVADFYSSSNQYDKEIELRKENLETISRLNDTVTTLEQQPEAVTPQKTNYKIGTAFLNQQKYNEAIPFLEKSIEEADNRKDLIIKKDAKRKLSEVYDGLGDYEKAYNTYREYVDLVDTLVVKKEQQISQASRFSRDITLQQNRITSLEKDRELTESKISLVSKDNELATLQNKRQQFTIYALIIGMLLLAIAAFFMYRSIKQQKLTNNLLALRSLRSQMNPHFIFNALNSVNSYIASNDERNANRYLAEFSTLMRSVLENSDEDFIPLSKEVELLELYTKLEHSRFKDKFDYTITVDPEVNIDDFTIPPMLLQPYIENAIWHGLRYKEEKGNLKIDIAQIDRASLQIAIEDDGIGRKRSAELKTQNQLKQKSKGMGNIKKRITILNDMYKDKVDVHLEDAHQDGKGTKVVLTLKKD